MSDKNDSLMQEIVLQFLSDFFSVYGFCGERGSFSVSVPTLPKGPAAETIVMLW